MIKKELEEEDQRMVILEADAFAGASWSNELGLLRSTLLLEFLSPLLLPLALIQVESSA